MSLLSRIRRRLAPAILMYHRVATPKVDPWRLAVSPAAFESQVSALARRRTVLPLAEFGRRLSDGSLPADAVAITFDDGYLDNLMAAAPILERHEAPATVFVSTGFIGSQREFWWDELARLVLGHPRPIRTTLEIGDHAVDLDLPDNAETAHLEIWRRLQAMEDGRRETALSAVRRRLGGEPARAEDLPMNEEEVRRLAALPLISIGAHSVSHPKLSEIDGPSRAQEIGESRRACEAISGSPVTSFAYPYGAFSAAARASVADAGFAIACTTEETVAKPGADLLALPRIAAVEEDGENLLRRLVWAAA